MSQTPVGSGRLTWFLRKATASSLEHHLVCQVTRFGDVFWFATPRTPPLWQRGFFLVNYFGVATLVSFGEKRCRKNLPLHDFTERDRMSLSFRRRDRDGNVHHYFIPFDPMVLVALFGVSVVFALSAWIAFRAIVHESPQLVVASIVAALAVGFTTFAIAKLSVIRRGTLVSFGPKLMTAAMKRCYIFGYTVMGCACLLAALFAMAV